MVVMYTRAVEVCEQSVYYKYVKAKATEKFVELTT